MAKSFILFLRTVKLQHLNFFFLLSLSLLSVLSVVPDPPMIDLTCSRVYNEGQIHWRLSDDTLPTDYHVLEYRKMGAGEQEGSWQATDHIYGSSTVVCNLDSDSLYSFRVKSHRNTMCSPYSPEVTFHTPPATGEWRLNELSCTIPFRDCVYQASSQGRVSRRLNLLMTRLERVIWVT